MLDRYIDQAGLLIDVLPHIANEPVFALNGGTAINLFYRDMPRLSVDIDLTYVPVEDRDASWRHIDETFDRIIGAISRGGPRYRARRIAGGGNNCESAGKVTPGRHPKGPPLPGWSFRLYHRASIESTLTSRSGTAVCRHWEINSDRRLSSGSVRV